MEWVLYMTLTYANKCGTQYKQEIVTGFKTEKACIVEAELNRKSLLKHNKTNVLEYNYDCYQRQ